MSQYTDKDIYAVLIKIADTLDQAGQEKSAEIIDDFIKNNCKEAKDDNDVSISFNDDRNV